MNNECPGSKNPEPIKNKSQNVFEDRISFRSAIKISDSKQLSQF